MHSLKKRKHVLLWKSILTTAQTKGKRTHKYPYIYIVFRVQYRRWIMMFMCSSWNLTTFLPACFSLSIALCLLLCLNEKKKNIVSLIVWLWNFIIWSSVVNWDRKTLKVFNGKKKIKQREKCNKNLIKIAYPFRKTFFNDNNNKIIFYFNSSGMFSFFFLLNPLYFYFLTDSSALIKS